MKKKKKFVKFLPRGASHQRPKAWSKRQEENDPRKQRKLKKTIYFDGDFFTP